MYQKNYNAGQLSLNAKLSLQRVFEVLNQANASGISLDDFANENKLATSDVSFAELLRTNFSKLDTDKDSVLSSTELSELISQIDSKGLSYEQLRALATSDSTVSESYKTLISTVLENFNKVDTNHDGKVSEDEINAYQFNKEYDDKKTEMYEFKASNITNLYDDSLSTSTEETDTTTTTSKTKTTSSTTY